MAGCTDALHEFFQPSGEATLDAGSHRLPVILLSGAVVVTIQ